MVASLLALTRIRDGVALNDEIELTFAAAGDRIKGIDHRNQRIAMTVRLIAGCTVLLFGAVVIIFVAGFDGAKASLLRPHDRKIVALGQELYAAECASCHGIDRKGQPGWENKSSDGHPLAPPHDGSGHTSQHPDHALIELTKYGSSDVACRTLDSDAMPEFQETLSDEQVIAVLSYIKAQWPAEIQRQHDEVNAVFGGATHK